MWAMRMSPSTVEEPKAEGRGAGGKSEDEPVWNMMHRPLVFTEGRNVHLAENVLQKKTRWAG